MELINETDFEAGWTLGFERDGRELLIVVVKATYSIPENDEPVRLADEQVPLTEADEFTGEPGHSATKYESDYAHRKPMCDVLVNGCAYAPDGHPTTRVPVGLRVGSIRKTFQVVGHRHWHVGLLRTRATRPEPFEKLPISYDVAYGGADATTKNPDKILTFADNPIGVGYHPLSTGSDLHGKPLPNTEESRVPVQSFTAGYYVPKSLGPLARNVPARVQYAGTYDEEWTRTRAPFWPEDFDYRYFQSAPKDQQMPPPVGGEEVTILNMTSSGVARFKLPDAKVPILIVPYRAPAAAGDAQLDTILVEPENMRVALTWRLAWPLRRNCFEIRQLIVGQELRAWRRTSRQARKPRYRSLDDLIRRKRSSRTR